MSRVRAWVGDRWEQDDSEKGVATVWAVGAIAALMLIMMFGVGLGLAVGGRHRAEAAADLAALAAAAHALDGEEAACAYGDRVVAAMEGQLRSCRVDGWQASVEVETRTWLPLIPGGNSYGRARAGPVDG